MTDQLSEDDLRELIAQTFSRFEMSFAYRLYKATYDTNATSKQIVDEFKEIKFLQGKGMRSLTHKWDRLNRFLFEIKGKELATVKDLKKVLEPLGDAVDFLEMDDALDGHKKAVLDSLKSLFEEERSHELLDETTLWNLLAQYYQVRNRTLQGTVSEEQLTACEQTLRHANSIVWRDYLTTVENYQRGNSFAFLTIPFSSLPTGKEEQFSATLLTSSDLAKETKMDMGYLLPFEDNFVDLYPKESSLYHSSLISPSLFSSQREAFHDRLVLSSKKAVNPVGIFCLTFGERQISPRYREAATRAMEEHLPLLEIDVTQYRKSSLTEDEKTELATNFLLEYYRDAGLEESEFLSKLEKDLEDEQLIFDVLYDYKRYEKEQREPVLFSNLVATYRFRKEWLLRMIRTIGSLFRDLELVNRSIASFAQAINMSDNQKEKSYFNRKKRELNERRRDIEVELAKKADQNIYEESIRNSSLDYDPFLRKGILEGGKTRSFVTGYKPCSRLQEEESAMLEQEEDTAKRYLIHTVFGHYQLMSQGLQNHKVRTHDPSLDSLASMADAASQYVPLSMALKQFQTLSGEEEKTHQKLLTMNRQLEILKSRQAYYRLYKELVENEKQQKKLLAEQQGFKTSIEDTRDRVAEALDERNRFANLSTVGKVFAKKELKTLARSATGFLDHSKDLLDYYQEAYRLREEERIRLEATKQQQIADFLKDFPEFSSLEEYQKQLEEWKDLSSELVENRIESLRLRLLSIREQRANLSVNEQNREAMKIRANILKSLLALPEDIKVPV